MNRDRRGGGELVATQGSRHNRRWGAHIIAYYQRAGHGDRAQGVVQFEYAAAHGGRAAVGVGRGTPEGEYPAAGFDDAAGARAIAHLAEDGKINTIGDIECSRGAAE